MATLYLGEKALDLGGGGGIAYVARIDEQNMDYVGQMVTKAGAYDVVTNPPTKDVRVTFYSASGKKIAERTTNAAGTEDLDATEDVASVGVTLYVPGDQKRGDGEVKAVPVVEVEIRRVGVYLPELDYKSLDVYKTTEKIRRAGAACVLIVGGGMEGQASAGGTSVGSGGRTGRVKVVPYAKFTGDEMVTVSAAIPFGSPETAGVSSVGPYTSADGTFAPPLVSTQDFDTMPWDKGKVFGNPVICGSTGSGLGGNSIQWNVENGGYRIGKGGNCSGGTDPASRAGTGNGSGGGGGFWNGFPGGAGGPGAVFIQWLD